MPIVCNYSIEFIGLPEELAGIQDFLLAGLEKIDGGNWGEYILDLTTLYPGQEHEDEQSFVGIDADFRHPIAGRTWENGVFGWKADRRSMTIFGDARDVAPLGLARRLSLRHPRVRIEVRGTTEHEIIERWSVQNGEDKLLDHGVYEDNYLEHFVWIVKDGLRLIEPPEWPTEAEVVAHPPTGDCEDRSSLSCSCNVNSSPQARPLGMAEFEAELDALGG